MVKDFKLIALRPLIGCDERFRKVLKENEFYYFYNNYKVVDNRIKYDPLPVEDIFHINNISINISAIVGKNGSGKSTLVELVYLAFYNVAFNLRMFGEKNEDGEKISLVKKVNIELYYKIDTKFHKLLLNGNEIRLSTLKDLNGKFSKGVQIKEKKILIDLFYTVAVNYSHYALNSNHLGSWIKSIFHKNDGYQTPVVLNPFRNKGNIDINNEEYLTRSRLISNLLSTDSINSDIRQLAPNKIAKQIKFSLYPKKAEFRSEEQIVESVLYENRKEIIRSIFRIFSKSGVPRVSAQQIKLLELAENYLIKKSYTISKRYAPYQSPEFEFLLNSAEKNGSAKSLIFDLEKFNAYLESLAEDYSHITFKFKQAINFIKNISFYESRIGKYIDITELAKDLNQKIDKKSLIIENIPPSFFSFDIKFEKGGVFSSLSSGEKQKIFGSATLLYHLININSVKSGRGYTKYKYINIIFDEIELYYHPDMQRTFVNDLLKSLGKLNLQNIEAINIILITHSPFILSDIPNSNILFLNDNGYPNNVVIDIKTFGSNIHELLATQFFLNQGFVGEFAKNKIENLIDFYAKKNDCFNEQSAKNLISIVGDDLISARLSFMHKDIYENKAIEVENIEYESWLISELEKINKLK